ncbi:Corticotropin-releasing factor receptor 1 [Aphelenchoides besseyi]|nr:Corticotropin-releasing factor receptor 1 [Aphelenchoides besseyi]KAI6211549.1 Corticotropin-releasing factor receptor 1 [Aphelenchoides besseyi]
MIPTNSTPCTSTADCSNSTRESAIESRALLPLNSTVMSVMEQNEITEQMIMIWICVVGYVISTLLCLGSLYVFRHFTKLWCLRNLVHANFIGCIATHNICWLLLAGMLSLGLHSCWLTAFLVEVAKFCVASTFCWMLVEGAYLYLSILYCLHAHRMKYWMCATVGWGLPFALSMRGIWSRFAANTKAISWNLKDDEIPQIIEGDSADCLDLNETLDNLTVTIIIIIIFTNVAILLAVIYVLFTKFRQVSDKEWAGLRHIFRALLFLCPLLGINYAFTIYHPENPEWLSTVVAFYSLFINASQGTFISIFFCFNHEEVRACLRRSFVITRNSLTIKIYELRRKSTDFAMEESQLTFLA